jgi:hypothetical protein
MTSRGVSNPSKGDRDQCVIYSAGPERSQGEKREKQIKKE